MTENKKGRIIESLTYGLPVMPFSDTHDGRTVHMLKKIYDKNSKHHSIVEHNQNDLTKKLTNLYGSKEVPVESFNTHLDQVSNILHNQNDILFDQLNENVKTNENLENIANINSQGFDNLDQSLGKINQSVNKLDQTTHEGFRNLSNIFSHGLKVLQAMISSGFRQLDSAIRAVGRDLKGPTQPQLSVKNYISSHPENLGKIVKASICGITNSQTKDNVVSYLSEKIGWYNKDETEYEAGIINSTTAYQVIIEEYNKVFWERGFKNQFPTEQTGTNFHVFIKSPASFIFDEIHSLTWTSKVIPFLKIINVNQKYKDAFVNTVYSFINTVMSIAINSKQISVSDLVFYVNNHYLIDEYSHVVKEHNREARKEGSLVDINFGVKDLNDQIDLSNNLLSSITNEMSLANNHLVNLEKLSEAYLKTSIIGFQQTNETLWAGFNDVNDALDEVNETLVQGFTATNKNLIQLHRAVTMIGLKLIDELQFWSKNILEEINYTNQLLEKIIQLNINSLKVEGKQRLEQGVFLLKLNDFEDALDSFKDGIKQDRTNQYLYFGAGLSLEMQNQFQESIKFYKKSAARAQGANDYVFASASIQKIARLYYLLQENENAIENLSMAIELNPKNITAKFELAKVLTEKAYFDKSRNIILELIKYDNKFLKLIKYDNSFQTMPIESIYEELINRNIVTEENLVIELLNDFLVLKNKEYALMINKSLINNGISYKYLELRIWKNPAFDTIKEKFVNFLKEKNNKNSLLSYRNQRYSASFLLFYLDFSDREIANCFIEELNNDKYKLYQDGSKILEQLNRIDKENIKIFISKISIYLSKFEWLKF